MGQNILVWMVVVIIVHHHDHEDLFSWIFDSILALEVLQNIDDFILEILVLGIRNLIRINFTSFNTKLRLAFLETLNG